MDEHEFLGHFIIWVICFALATLEGKESGISLLTAIGTSLIIFIPIEVFFWAMHYIIF